MRETCELRDSGELDTAYSGNQENETQHAKSHEREFANSKIQESKIQPTQAFRRMKLSMPRVMRETCELRDSGE
jgi:hypothetical protein